MNFDLFYNYFVKKVTFYSFLILKSFSTLFFPAHVVQSEVVTFDLLLVARS